MTFELKLPEIGEGVVEGEIVKWLVKEGDPVAEDQPVVEVMTDKATVTVPSPRTGKVVRTHAREGEIAKVHQTLITLEVDGESPAPAPEEGGERQRALATPVTRRMAREHGIDIAEIHGSGPGGRVTKQDLAQVIGGKPAPLAPRAQGLAPRAEDRRVPLKGLRRRIAEKMVRAKSSAPHFTFVEELDATELVALRERLNQALEAAGDSQRLSYLPFLCKALVAAFRKHPTLNAVFDEAAQELVVRGEYNLGIATATEEGLIVPVVKQVDRLSLRELASEISRLSSAAREKKLSLDELSGGTFTITSLGQRGGLLATPIINHPEVAILGLHRIRKRPVVGEGEKLVIRQIAYLSLSFDHRVIDGAEGAAFTYELIRYLERPELLLL